jgi:hypothetical protein
LPAKGVEAGSAGARRVFGLNSLTDGGDQARALRRLADWERA